MLDNGSVVAGNEAIQRHLLKLVKTATAAPASRIIGLSPSNFAGDRRERSALRLPFCVS